MANPYFLKPSEAMKKLSNPKAVHFIGEVKECPFADDVNANIGNGGNSRYKDGFYDNHLTQGSSGVAYVPTFLQDDARDRWD